LNPEDLKRMAAEKAVDFVEDGMTVGLGTGSTAYYAIKAVGRLVDRGYDLECVATSLQTERIARESGIEVMDMNSVDTVDLTIDGADEVDPSLHLIKGLGGALLREKIVAAATDMEVIVVDSSKLVQKLGTISPLPVEVLSFGSDHTAGRLKALGCEPVLRTKEGEAFITDGGNLIYDCGFPDGIGHPYHMESKINTIPGVVDNGLFLDVAKKVVVAHQDRLEILDKPLA